MAAYLCIVGASQTPVNSISECLAIDVNAYIAQSAATLAQQPTLQDIFAQPITSDLQQMWWLGFGLPILCYLTAYSFGVLINFFNPSHDNH